MHQLPHNNIPRKTYEASETTFILKNENGQTFLEFLLILLVMMGMSFAMLRGFNGGIGSRWTAIVKVIAKPNPPNIQLK